MSTQTSTAVISYQAPPTPLPTATEWETMTRMAQTLAKSGLVPSHLRTPEAAVAVILQGRELGIGAMQALRTIHLIEGRLTLSADLMAALIYHRCGGNALRIVERSAEQCVIDYQRPGWEAPARMTWTLVMAKQAGLTGKSNWQKHPDAMLFARCLSAIAHTAFQDVIMGLYTEDEAEEIAANEPAESRVITASDATSVSSADLPPITILSEPAAAATEAEHRPAPPARPEPPRQTSLKPSGAAFTEFWRVTRAAGWEQSQVNAAATDIYGAPAGSLNAQQLAALRDALVEARIGYDEDGKAHIQEPPVSAAPAVPVAKVEAALPV